MAESDRQRLRDLALALPSAEPSDFFNRRPPGDADPDLIKRINDTALRTKLVEARLAEGLQSPKGPQKIASIVRIYPDFDAPPRGTVPDKRGSAIAKPRAGSNGKSKAAPLAVADRRLPSVDEMEALIARIRSVESEVERHLASRADERIDRLKSALAHLTGDELEAAYAELGEALEEKRALRSQIRFETFARIEGDVDFAPRSYLRFLRR
jgi:hypothetical protein